MERRETEIHEQMQRRAPKCVVPRETRFLPILPVRVSGNTDRKILAMMLPEGAV